MRLRERIAVGFLVLAYAFIALLVWMMAK